jgi:hypothetical protein
MTVAEVVKSKAELNSAIDDASPTRISTRWTQLNQVIADLIDTTLDDQVIKTANYTVVINTDSGKTFVSALDAIVFTLPSIAIGNTFTIVNTADDGDAAINISPAAADGISYVGALDDDTDLINTKVTAKKGDFVTLASLDGVVSWQVVAVRGIWAKA